MNAKKLYPFGSINRLILILAFTLTLCLLDYQEPLAC